MAASMGECDGCPADPSIAMGSVPDGLLLVRVAGAQYRWHRRIPYYEISFAVLKPKQLCISAIALLKVLLDI
jgi:hypothetical protein